MNDEILLSLFMLVFSFIQVFLLSWIKYRQSECSLGNCKGSCTKVPDIDDKEKGNLLSSLIDLKK